MKKTGIFGGTFNPPHNGHTRLALNAADTLGLDRVIVIPDCIPPHKAAESLAGAEERLMMCRKAFGADSRFEVSSAEIDRGNKSYTVETLREFKSRYPDDEFYLIVGSDMLDSFTQWYCWEEILSLAFIVAASRKDGYLPKLSGFSESQKSRIIFLDSPPFEMSSSEIRENIRKISEIEKAVNPEVLEIIINRGLYASGDEKYISLLEAKLDEKRIYHSKCVSESAVRLAEKYGADKEKARVAGLMHDVMKNASVYEHILYAGNMTDTELANRKVWHQFSGAGFLKTNGIVTDEEILGAIRWHTTGKANMSLLEKVVYIADFISDDRDYNDVETVRQLAAVSLEDAILYTSKYTINKLVASGTVIHPATLDCYNDTVLNRKEKIL